MAISAVEFRVHNGGMERANTTAIAPAAGRGTVTRITRARTAQPLRLGAVDRARAARNELQGGGLRSQRFAHLKRMYD